MATLTRIRVTTLPNKTNYYEGEYFDSTGMVVKAYFSDGTNSVITGYSYSPTRALRTSDTFIQVSYNGRQDAFSISVGSAPIVSITATYDGSGKVFLGDFTTSDFIVTGTTSLGGTRRVYSFSMSYDWMLVDDYDRINVTITYNGLTCQVYNIDVLPRLTQIQVLTPPDKQYYYHGEKIQLAGLSVKALFNYSFSHHTYEIVNYSDLELEYETAQFKDSYTFSCQHIYYTREGITHSTILKLYKRTGLDYEYSYVEQKMGKCGVGGINLYFGNTKYTFPDYAGDGKINDINISHVYCSNATWTSDVGDKWRLNIYQELYQSGTAWIFIDENGGEYAFTNNYTAENNRSGIRNEKFGFDLFVVQENSIIKLVDRNNNSLIFTYLSSIGRYRLTEIHHYPSVYGNAIDDYSTIINYDSVTQKISSVIGGKTINNTRSTVNFVFSNNLLSSMTYTFGTQSVSISYEYGNAHSDTRLISVTKTYATVSQPISLTTEFAYADRTGAFLTEVTDLSSWYTETLQSNETIDHYKKLCYTYNNTTNKVSSFSTGYSADDIKTTTVAYTAHTTHTNDTQEFNIVQSTVTECEGNLSVTSFGGGGIISQYGYKGNLVNNTYNYDAPKRINNANSFGFGYYDFAKNYSDTRDICHDDFSTGAGHWTGGSLNSTKHIVGQNSYCLPANSSSTAYGSYTLNQLIASTGTAVYLSMWVLVGTSAKLTYTVSPWPSDKPVITQYVDGNLSRWQYVSVCLGKLAQNSAVTIKIDSSAISYVDDVRFVAMPYETPSDMGETEFDDFGRITKEYKYDPIEGAILSKEYLYSGYYLSTVTEKRNNVQTKKTVYTRDTVTTDLINNIKTYGSGAYYYQQNYSYSGRNVTQEISNDEITVNHETGMNYNQTTLVGDSNGSPDIVVRNEFYSATDCAKNVSSGDGKNALVYNSYGEQSQIKYAYDGIDIGGEDVYNSEYNFVYDTFGHLTQVKIGNDVIVEYEYDSKHLNSVNYANVDKVGMTYDDEDRLTSVDEILPNEQTVNLVQYTYSDDGKTTTIEHANGFEYTSQDVCDNGVTTVFGITSSANIEFSVKKYAIDTSDFTENVKYYFNDSSNAFEDVTTKKDSFENVKSITVANGHKHLYDYDNMNRLASQNTIYSSALQDEFKVAYNYKSLSGYRTTSRILSEIFTICNNVQNAYYYQYYVNGNISNISSFGTNINYVYDNMNRLIREDNSLLDKTFTFAYDTAGNILTKTVYPYTTGTLGTPTATYSYTYDTTRKDKLLSFGNDTISYDAYGSPTSYRGKSMTWKLRRLMTCDNVNMAYDYRGMRVKKGSTEYFWVGNQLKAQRTGNNYIYFYYDQTGICGIKYNGTDYYFLRNILGDVVAIYDTAHNLVCNYVYDAWGNHKVLNPDGTENTSSSFIGNINPIRYRGYYWDSEFDLYYLQSRYYDPETGRFISPDSTQYLDRSNVQGMNLYAYCNNNPVMDTDPEGTSILSALWTMSGLFLQAIVSAISYVAFCVLAIFDENIRNDMEAIGWNPFNNNKEAVVKSKMISFYRGVPVIRWTLKDRSGTFLMIFLRETHYEISPTTGEATITDDEMTYLSSTLKHEWGHVPQQMLIGPLKYLLFILLPSAASGKLDEEPYYNRPWEATAEVFGGRKSDDYKVYDTSKLLSLLYLAFIWAL